MLFSSTCIYNDNVALIMKINDENKKNNAR